jgi:hypothetical protein
MTGCGVELTRVSRSPIELMGVICIFKIEHSHSDSIAWPFIVIRRVQRFISYEQIVERFDYILQSIEANTMEASNIAFFD